MIHGWEGPAHGITIHDWQIVVNSRREDAQAVASTADSA